MKILVVDDSRSSLAFLGHVLQDLDGCEIKTCTRPEAALELCREITFDLALVDNVMPGMDGVELIERMRANESYQWVPIIMVTSDNDAEIRQRSIAAGATDFVTKPFDAIELKARVRNLLALRKAQTDLADRNSWLASEVEAATAHLADREEEIIWRLARAIEFRDGETGEHVTRVAGISQIIAEALGLDDEHCRTIYLAAPLHDIGKIGIADSILGKTGRLTDAEMATMRGHVDIGARILEKGSSEVIRVAELIAQSHHERWDGKGYPDGLSGTDIPVEARIVAVADVFDALCSERPYKRAWPVENAYAEILRCSGAHFDPDCVRAFETEWSKIKRIMDFPVAARRAAAV